MDMWTVLASFSVIIYVGVLVAFGFLLSWTYKIRENSEISKKEMIKQTNLLAEMAAKYAAIEKAGEDLN